jgi:hypothetical protein
MMSLEEAIEHAEDIAISAIGCECREEHRQLAEWLRELQERRKADSCEGCKSIGLWENEYENGVSCPCLRCSRRAKDNYEPERSAE